MFIGDVCSEEQCLFEHIGLSRSERHVEKFGFYFFKQIYRIVRRTHVTAYGNILDLKIFVFVAQINYFTRSYASSVSKCFLLEI